MRIKNHKKVLVIITGILVCIYGLAWATFGLSHTNANRAINKRYGHIIQTYQCPGGGQFESWIIINNKQNDTQNGYGQLESFPDPPFILKPFYNLKGFLYQIYYVKDGQTLQASGTVSQFGSINETYASKPYCGPFLHLH